MVRTLTLSLTVFAGVASMVAPALGVFGRTAFAQQAMVSPVVSLPGSAELLTMDSGTMRVLAEGKTTNGAVTVLDSVLRPGYWTNPHTHNFAESFYVYEGTMTVEIAGVRHQLTPGSYAWVPPNVSHALGNDGGSQVRNVLTTTPAGIETMFRRRAEEFRKTNPPKP